MPMARQWSSSSDRAETSLDVDKKPEAPPTDLKTQQIQRQGCWQAAANNPALIGYAADLEAWKQVVAEAAEAGIAFINRK